MKTLMVGALCPALCGYQFDKGFVDMGPVAGVGGNYQAVGICSRCKRWLVIRDNALHTMSRAETIALSKEARKALLVAEALTLVVESRHGRY